MAKKITLTTTGGNPIGDNQNALTAGARGLYYFNITS